MADQVSTFGLDDGPFVRGLGKMEAESARAAAGIDSQWARANRGVGEMAESVHGMSRIMRLIVAPTHLLHWAEQGVEKLEALYNAGQKFREELDKISESASRLTEGVLAGSGRQSEGFKSALELSRQYQEKLRAIDEQVQKARETRSGVGEALGVYKLFGAGSISDLEREAEARKRIIENQSRQAQAIQGRESRAKEQEQAKKDAAKADDEIAKRYADMVRENEERLRGQEAVDKEASERAKAHDDAVFALDVEDQRARIGLLRAAGMEKESDELRTQLELAQQLRDIEKNANLSDEEKRRFSGQARQAAELALGVIRDRPDDPHRAVSSGTVTAGAGGATLGQAFLGKSVDHQKKTAENSTALVTLVKEVTIAIKSLTGMGAVVQ